MATPADIQNVYDDIRERMMDTEDSTELKKFNEARAKAMTDDQARYNILRGLVGADKEGTLQMPMDTTQAKLYNGWPVREEEIAIPTTANVLSSLSYKDVKDNNGNVTKTAQEQFIEDYLKKPKYLVKELEKKNKGFGSKSADILREAFKESVYDEAERKTRERRESVMNATAEDATITDKILSPFMSLFMSNQKEAYMRGEDPSIGDYMADIGGNALMFVPGEGWVTAASKVPKVAPAVARVANVATTKAPRLAPKVVGMTKSVAGNAVAPVATEGLQYLGDAIDSDRDAAYNSSRAVLGTLTNVGVNDLLLRNAGKIGRLLLDKDAGRAATKEARAALKGASTGTSDKVFRNAIGQDNLQAYVVNKLGGDRSADLAASQLGMSPKVLKDLRENSRDVNDSRYPQREIDMEGLDPIDVMYIQKVIENPSMVTDSKDTDFKMWYATRGNELLRGTEYHTPTWEVNF